MADFVFSNHSLACYRLYEKSNTDVQNLVTQGDSIDVEGGPLQEVCIWRRFAELSTNAYTAKGDIRNKSSSIALLFDRYDFTYAAVQSQNIVVALTESLSRDGEEVQLSALSLDIPIHH